MYEIKLIEPTSDLSNRYKVDWDTYIHNEPYDVYRFEGFIHSIGGRWGENDYWACPRGEEPTYENLIEFSGHVVNWGIVIQENNYTKTKWGETEARQTVKCVITRNGKDFMDIQAGSIDYAYTEARHTLYRLQEHPINVQSQNWDTKLLGRKIYYENIPAIIERVSGADIFILPDNDEKCFPCPYWYAEEWSEEDWKEEYGQGMRTDILSSNIGWFRD